MMPTVSVVIATRNYGRYLPETLESVRRQTFGDFECVIVDDGSTDDTPRAVGPFLADPRFRHVVCEGLGQARAKSLGARLASGRFVAFLDGDDVWLPTKLERQVRLLRADPRLGMVHTMRSLIGPDGEHLGHSPHRPERGQVLGRVLINNTVCFSSAMVRREVLEHLGAFNPGLDLAIDYDLWLRVTRHYPIDYVDEVLVRYRTGHANLSRRVMDRIHIAMSIQRRFLDRWRYADVLTPEVVRTAWSSTCRTAGYLQRSVGLFEALKWYARAFGTGQGRGETCRAVLGALLRAAKGCVRRARGGARA